MQRSHLLAPAAQQLPSTGDNDATGGALRSLQERVLLKRLKGVGDGAVDIFFRQVRAQKYCCCAAWRQLALPPPTCARMQRALFAGTDATFLAARVDAQTWTSATFYPCHAASLPPSPWKFTVGHFQLPTPLQLFKPLAWQPQSSQNTAAWPAHWLAQAA